ncbi:MAG: SSI family serine proteinase inhibitor [Gaiellaceae bacterium]|jgi:hypothetical protein
MIRILVAFLVLVSLVGCGGASSASSASAKLRITVWPQGKNGRSAIYTLGCPRATGTLPAAHAACSKLRRAGVKAFAPVPPSTACSMIYGGPQIARVTGRLAGQPIKADFNRTNGCEVERWNRLAFLFPTRS